MGWLDCRSAGANSADHEACPSFGAEEGARGPLVKGIAWATAGYGPGASGFSSPVGWERALRGSRQSLDPTARWPSAGPT
jgi:hypothetical protein